MCNYELEYDKSQWWHFPSSSMLNFIYSSRHMHTISYALSRVPFPGIQTYVTKLSLRPIKYQARYLRSTLQWRHNGRDRFQITSLTIVYSIDYSDADQRKHQRSASLAFVRGLHRGPVNSPHKWPVTRKMFPFDDVIMTLTEIQHRATLFDSHLPFQRQTLINLSSLH